jgi:6-pyruvoyltetrahydropterin/6-carboxytetrahydropterin synthase
VLRLTKRYPFSASHRLHTAKLSDEENSRLFGKCNNPFGHGHNYVLEVSLAGEPDLQTGMMLSRPELDAFVERTILSKIDHADLNADVPEFQDVVPTTENLALWIDRRLRQAWPREFGERPVQLAGIRIEETGRNSFEVVNPS